MRVRVTRQLLPEDRADMRPWRTIVVELGQSEPSHSEPRDIFLVEERGDHGVLLLRELLNPASSTWCRPARALEDGEAVG